MLLRSVNTFSGSYACIDAAAEWLQACLEQHLSCKAHRDINVTLPTRIIDVDLATDELGARPRLIDSSTKTDGYVALSYCWGGDSPLTFKRNTESTLRSGIGLHQYPPTLRDAIVVTRQLGFRYIWIDALCIQQDSKADWNAESAKMRSVYRGASLTLSASAATKTTEGIFCHRKAPIATCKLPWLSSAQAGQHVYLRPAIEVMDSELRASFITTRAWTLQEGLLARRTLWLGRSQIMLECCEGQVNEAGHSTQTTEYYRNKDMLNQLSQQRITSYTSRMLRSLKIPPVIHVPYWTLWRASNLNGSRNRMSRGLMKWHLALYTQGWLLSQSGRAFTMYHQWREIVREYTKRNLTNIEDTLPALSGLAEQFARATGDQYVAGLWKGDLVRCLAWHRIRPDRSQLNDHPTNRAKLGKYIAPSWTWASITGGTTHFPPMENGTEENHRFHNIARICKVTVDYAGADPFGRLTHGELDLRAPYLAVPSPLVQHHPGARYPALHEYLHDIQGLAMSEAAHNFHQQHQAHNGQRFALLQTCLVTEVNIADPVKMLYMILIESTGNGRYRRLAQVSMQKGGRLVGSLEDPWKGIKVELRSAQWIEKTVTLV